MFTVSGMEVGQPRDGQVGRRRPASGVLIFSGQPTIVFLTVVTRGREPWLTQPVVHRHLRETWMEAQSWLVGYYLLMPDHLHLFCAPRDLRFTLDQWVTYWKRRFKRKLGTHPGRVSVLANPEHGGGGTVQASGRMGSAEPHPPEVDAWGVRFLTETDLEFRERWVRAVRHLEADEGRSSKESPPPLLGDPAGYRWQEGKPWDTRLRRSENYQQKWQYVRENPVRKRFVEDASHWPYQGMLNVLRW